MLKAPFPYFGGKSRVASLVWSALGQPEHYMEPFFGSGAVLLARPGYEPKYTETICDKDGYVANVWRSLQFAPDEVARWCDWPVNHADLIARKRELLTNDDRLLESLTNDPEWYDAKLAGYWIWAASCSIGPGVVDIGASGDVGQKIPNMTAGGVHSVGISGGIPFLAHSGVGTNKRECVGHDTQPHIADGGVGVHAKSVRLYDWFRELSNRLRNVRVVCGDWSRICGGNWQDKAWKTVGVFFDPPYGAEDRADVYRHDSTLVAAEAALWALERGRGISWRIVFAGYEGEHQNLVDAGWRVVSWETSGGYANTAHGDSRGKVNKSRERLFMSPYCIDLSVSRFVKRV